MLRFLCFDINALKASDVLNEVKNHCRQQIKWFWGKGEMSTRYRAPKKKVKNDNVMQCSQKKRKIHRQIISLDRKMRRIAWINSTDKLNAVVFILWKRKHSLHRKKRQRTNAEKNKLSTKQNNDEKGRRNSRNKILMDEIYHKTKCERRRAAEQERTIGTNNEMSGTWSECLLHPLDLI